MRTESRRDIKLEDGRLSGPWAALHDRTVAGRDPVSKEKILGSPAGPRVERIMHDLAIHLLTIQVSPRANLLKRRQLGRALHRTLRENTTKHTRRSNRGRTLGVHKQRVYRR